MNPDLTCACCGDPATLAYGLLDTSDGTVTSLNGLGRLTPSCEGCAPADVAPYLPIRVSLTEMTTAVFYGHHIGRAEEAYLDWVDGLPEVQS
jgi:hypothetical protein